MFKLGDKWYIFFSRYCHDQKTHYRVSDSMYGPWKVPYPDAVNTRCYYAVKSLFDGEKRLGAAWVFDRLNENDNGSFQWGGDLGMPYEFVQQPDGTLNFKVLEAAVDAYKDKEIPYKLEEGLLGSFVDDNGVITGGDEGYTYAKIAHEDGPVMVEMDIEVDDNVEECGIIFRSRDDLNKGYRLGIRPDEDTAIIALWPERMDPNWDNMLTTLNEESIGYPELSTYGYPPVRAQMGLRGTKVFNIKLFLTNSLVEANVNGKVAMAFRQYDKADGMIGIYTQAGKATFKNIHIYQPVD